MGGGGPPTVLHRSRVGGSLAGEPSQEAGDEGPLCIIKVTKCQLDVFMLFQRPQPPRGRKDEFLPVAKGPCFE